MTTTDPAPQGSPEPSSNLQQLPLAPVKSVRGPAASSFTLGLISIFAGLIAGIPAIIMGFIAKKRGKASHEKSTLATVGITLGVLFTVINILVVAVLAVAANKAYDKAQNEADQVRVDLNAAKMSLLYVGGIAKGVKSGQTDGLEQTAATAAAAEVSKDGQTQVVVEEANPGQPIQVALSNSHGCVTFTLVSAKDIQEKSVTAPDLVRGADGTTAKAVPGAAPVCG